MPEQDKIITNIKIPKQSITYLLICLAGIFVFIVLGIIPNSRSIAGLDKKIKETELRLQEQKDLLPIYQKFVIEGKKSFALPMPEKGAISKGDNAQISETFRKLAKKSALETISIAPDLSSLASSPGALSVDMVLEGEYYDFRNFLIQIGGIPYFRHIELIDIQQTADAKKIRIKVWLAVT